MKLLKIFLKNLNFNVTKIKANKIISSDIIIFTNGKNKEKLHKVNR